MTFKCDGTCNGTEFGDCSHIQPFPPGPPIPRGNMSFPAFGAHDGDSEEFNKGRAWQQILITQKIVAFLRRPMKDGHPCTVEREHLARCIERGDHLK